MVRNLHAKTRHNNKMNVRIMIKKLQMSHKTHEKFKSVFLTFDTYTNARGSRSLTEPCSRETLNVCWRNLMSALSFSTGVKEAALSKG